MMHCREVKGCVCVCVCVAAALRDSPGRASGQGEGEQSGMIPPSAHQHACSSAPSCARTGGRFSRLSSPPLRKLLSSKLTVVGG